MGSTLALKNRIIWLDILKCILIIFVVMSHAACANIYSYFFAPFFLTMFFFASGYTFSLSTNFFVFAKGKIMRLLVPLISIGLIKIIVAVVIEKDDFFTRFSGLLVQISGNKDDLWFLACLFSALFVFYLIEKLSHDNDLMMLIISSFALVTGFLDIYLLKIKFPWHLETAFIMSFYMALGKIYRKNEIEISKIIKRRHNVIMFIIYIVIVYCFKNQVDIHLEIYQYPVVFVVTSILIILPIINFAKFLESIISTNIKRVMLLVGQNTLFIYSFENYVIKPFYLLLRKINFGPDQYLAPVLCSVLTVLVLLVPAMLINQYMPWIVGQKKRRDNNGKSNNIK